MSERGQKTRLSLGSVTAEIALLQTSGKPREARHDVRRGEEASPAQKKREAEAIAGADDGEGTLGRIEHPDDPLGAGADPHPSEGAVMAPAPGGEASTPQSVKDALAAVSEPLGAPDFEVEPTEEPAIRHGVWREEEWIDLTEKLEAIDKRTSLEGMDLVATIPSAAVPRERVRGAYFIATADPEANRVLALLGIGLAVSHRVAVVRWTKRTNQALGIIVPRSYGRTRALGLLELEWAQNMRKPNPRVTGPHDLSLYETPVTSAEMAAAVELVESFAASPEALDALRDERVAQRAELLEAARKGKEWEPPEPEPPPNEEVAGAFAAAAAH